MIHLIYNILFSLFFIISAPYYFWKMWRRGNWQNKFFERFGLYNNQFKKRICHKPVVWFHAVSVGEVNICIRLVKEIFPKLKNYKIVVSTTTSTGMEGLLRGLPDEVEKIYYPIDFFFSVSRAFNVIRPTFIVIVEAEIWPNFLWTAQKKDVPVFLVNARLSERSFNGYQRFGILFKEIFKSFAAVGCCDEKDRERLIKLGCKPENVLITGNLKFDTSIVIGEGKLDVKGLLNKIGVPPYAKIIVGGSTHNGEEEILARIFISLKKQFPDLFLILVPRHFERTKSVVEVLENLKIPFVLRTEISQEKHYEPGSIQCLVVNTTGELKEFYKVATAVFVGKSLTAEGGQNPIEPAALGKPIVFGPNMQNFSAIVKILLNRQAAIQVKDEPQLEAVFQRILKDSEFAKKVGDNALKVINENRGAIEKTMSMMFNVLKEKGIEIS